MYELENIREYCLKIHGGVTEDMPFGDDILVFRIANKIFLLTSLHAAPISVNLKCNPERAVKLRLEYPENILPGYHMNKTHWNTVLCTYPLRSEEIKDLILHSFSLVFDNLSKKDKNELNVYS